MRIVCDNCGAKYSIADDKVAGKLFKVRCKKCGNTIMVDGTTLAVDQAAAPAADDQYANSMGADGAAWYVVIDGAQTGPLTLEEVTQQVGAGQIDADTFAWHEGMADWSRIGDIAELAGAIAPPPAPAPAPSPERHEPKEQESFEDEATRVVDSTAAPAAAAPAVAQQATSGLFGAPPVAASTADDFFSANVAASAARVDAPSETGIAADDDALVGERHESSVLFSLNDLTSSKKKKKADDLPRTDGSGLIDIRVLASSQQSVDGGAAPLGGTSGSGSMSVAPVVPLPPRKSNTALIALIALGSAVLFGLIVAIAVVVLRDDPVAPNPSLLASAGVPEPTAADDDDAPVPAGEQLAAAPDAGGIEGSGSAVFAAEGSGSAMAAIEGSALGADGDALTQAEVAVAEAAVAEQASRDDDDDDRDRDDDDDDDDRADDDDRRVAEAEPRSSRRDNSGRDRESERDQRSRRTDSASSSSRSPRSEHSASSDDEGRDGDAVANALDTIRRRQEGGSDDSDDSSSASSSGGSSSSGGNAQPQTLSRSEVQSAIRRYRSRLRRCAEEGESGTYRVRFVIQPGGSVTNVSPGESDDTSQCVASVVRDMSFPPFQGAAIPVTYPFRL